MRVHLQNIYVMFVHQCYRVKVKVTGARRSNERNWRHTRGWWSERQVCIM